MGDRTWTYAQVAERAGALARALQNGGLTRGERAYTVLPDLPPFAWAIFATLTAGGVVAMGNPIAPAEDLRRVIDYIVGLFRVTDLPARMLALVSRTPGILAFSPVTAGAAVELGYRHPI